MDKQNLFFPTLTIGICQDSSKTIKICKIRLNCTLPRRVKVLYWNLNYGQISHLFSLMNKIRNSLNSFQFIVDTIQDFLYGLGMKPRILNGIFPKTILWRTGKGDQLFLMKCFENFNFQNVLFSNLCTIFVISFNNFGESDGDMTIVCFVCFCVCLFWKGYLPNLLEITLCHQIFVFWVRYLKFWLLAYFFILLNCAKFQQDWTTLILDIL